MKLRKKQEYGRKRVATTLDKNFKKIAKTGAALERTNINYEVINKTISFYEVILTTISFCEASRNVQIFNSTLSNMSNLGIGSTIAKVLLVLFSHKESTTTKRVNEINSVQQANRTL